MSKQEPSQPRDVRSKDPSLSPEANRALTEELREVVGEERVEVPASRPHVERAAHGRRSVIVVGLVSNRLVIAMTLLVALVVGAIVSLATGSWWFLALALGVHAFGTLVIVGVVLQMTGETEHLSPSVAARLEAEGVDNPDAVFGALVEEFAPGERGGDERTTPAHEDAAQAATEQRSAVTPSHDASKPVGP